MFKIERPTERVSVLRMDDGKVNAIGPAFLAAFPGAWAEATEGGRAVVLASTAKAFCAGLDLKALPSLEPSEMGGFARGFMGVFRDVLTYERPVVAAVDGAALAGGAILALAADLRFVGPRAKLGVTEVPVGIPFPSPVAELCRRKLPVVEHAPAVLGGAIREGEACVATGWAHRSFSSDALLREAIAAADELGSLYSVAFASGKRSLNGDLPQLFENFAKNEADHWVDLVSSPETIEAILGYFGRVTAKK